MAVTVSLSVTPAAPAHGQTVTAVYSVQGNSGSPGGSATVAGNAVIGGLSYGVSTVITMPATGVLPQSFAVPVCPGLTFSQSASDPTGATFTALVP